MSVTIHEVLDELRASALDERDKGDKFERLMQGYFRIDPQWAQQFSDVWLWSEWPHRGSRPDTGIDLVAKERNGEELTAIQCKFYAPGTYIQKAHIDSFFTASGKTGFGRRIVVSTSDHWSKNAEEALADQQVSTQRLDVSYLSESTVDWSEYSLATPSVMPTHGPKRLRPHQTKALQAVRAGLGNADRGRLIMACGTGKTFTSLKIAEDLVGVGGSVLFLVPSISLLSQTLREWVQEAAVGLRPFAVCSDVRVGRRQTEDMSVVDLAEPATTSGATLMQRMARTDSADPMTVVFSTYQSIQAIADAQRLGLGEFDLVICDEAHRTTGVTLAGEDESSFVRVHDPSFLKARKRLYMTATPRLYDDGSRTKAAEASAVLASMDDESLYGPELHRLGFGEAVDHGLLADYKVLVLAVDETAVSAQFQSQLADNAELRLDDAAKLVGCWSGLAKRNLDQERLHVDTAPMRRAVAFAETIKASKKVAELFGVVSDQLAADSDDDAPLRVDARHVDGTYNVLARNNLLDWLKADQNGTANSCRVLSNARCLSEGVDVPALDAVLFLNPRNSVVDVVQSVGRVMRRAPGKEYGYVILPIGIPTEVAPEQALSDNKKYRVVWQVLQALRAHDDRFDAMVNKIELNRARDDKLQVIGVPGRGEFDAAGDGAVQGRLALSWSDEWRDAIYAKIVARVGERRYWETWATDIARIAEQHTTRIRALLDDPGLDVDELFSGFLAGLRHNLNDAISRDDAIDMLAQHLITRPVFDALFEGYDFAARNPVSIVMEDMLEALDEQGIDKESETLDKFYRSVRLRAARIDNAEGKQKIVTELYERFFKTAFPKAAASLGIVYTPVEIVDFMIRGVQHMLQTEFDSSLSDEGVHVLDPFTGTGTFIVRLLQSGFVEPADLLRKYTSELHANEINLLAYYIAAVNIEATFHGIVGGDYQPFGGIVLADTFQIHEADDTMDELIFPRNNDRVVRQKATDIRVILANPPYSVGQDSANDDNANLKYPTLDARIETTYARRSTAKLKVSLRDSYVRAIRWASDRIDERGIVCYVSNGGYIDSNSADGLRQCLVDDFDQLYVYNLRGNQRTSGDQSRKEGGKVFGSGSRATIAVLLAVKNGGRGAAALHYREVGDYLTRDQKLRMVAESDLVTGDWQTITQNVHGDWINQRRDDFMRYAAIGDKSDPGIFARYSGGLKTNRDAWVYNHSRGHLVQNVMRAIDFYNGQINSTQPSLDSTKFSWDVAQHRDLARGRRYELEEASLRVGVYRPFTRQHVYFNRTLNNSVYQLPRIFPTAEHENIGIYNVGMGSAVPFSVLMLDALPDLHVTGAGSGGQFFPRWTYEKNDGDDLFADGATDGYTRVDTITDTALKNYRATYGDQVTKDDIFSYVYGLLHSPAYRTEFAADLKKMLPRIPKVADFTSFATAGRRLADLHVGYESAEPYPMDEQVTGSGPESELYRVQKMTFARSGKDKDRSRIVYNSRIALAGIPDEAYRYQLGARSAVEWIMDRYQVRTDKASGVVNDPNDWATEHDNPRYILDLLTRIVTVSVETMRIVDNLPALDIIEHQPSDRS